MPICVENLTVSYQSLPAVHHVDMLFKEGESWAIFGPNGAGKSTLLKAIMGLEPIDTGCVRLDGLKKKDIAYLPQMADIDRSLPMTVFELAAMGLWYEIGFFRGLNADQARRVSQVLARVGMKDYENRAISELSNGQFQRVLFARMLLQEAKFLLLDEPFNAIDAQTTFSLLQILCNCLEEGKGVIAVLHNYEEVRAYFSHTLLIARQKIAAGKTDAVLVSPYLEQAMAFKQDIFEAEVWCSVSEEEGEY